MRYYLTIYKKLLTLNLSLFLSYRTNFVGSMISSLCWGLFEIVVILLLTTQTDSVYGWSRGELLLLSSTYVIFIGIFNCFFAANFEQLPRLILYGELDYILLKPLDSQFTISLGRMRFNALVRLILGLGLLFYVMVVKLNYPINPVKIILYFVLLSLSLLIVYSTWLVVTTLLIWSPKLHNLIDLLYSLNTLSRFPQEMYREIFTFFFFFVLPFTYVTFTPTKLLLQKITYLDLLSLLFSILLFLWLSRKIWLFGLRHYTGASS